MSATFKSLKIERGWYGEDKGKLIGKLDISSKSGELTLNLPHELAERLLQIAKSAMIDSVEQTANDFIFELTTSIPDTLNLENNP